MDYIDIGANLTHESFAHDLPAVLERARAEIRRSWRETCELNKNHPQAAELFNPDKLPAFHDPFAGGGALPLEAQRLGLESYASDLNPVAVTINKAMIAMVTRSSMSVNARCVDERRAVFLREVIRIAPSSRRQAETVVR